MTRICCIPDCRNQSDHGKGQDLSFFSFPKDEVLRNKWLEEIEKHYQKKIKLIKSLYVCSLHFNAESFYYSGLCQILKLKKESIPHIFGDSNLNNERTTSDQPEKIVEQSLFEEESAPEQKNLSKCLTCDLVSDKPEDVTQQSFLGLEKCIPEEDTLSNQCDLSSDKPEDITLQSFLGEQCNLQEDTLSNHSSSNLSSDGESLNLNITSNLQNNKIISTSIVTNPDLAKKFSTNRGPKSILSYKVEELDMSIEVKNIFINAQAEVRTLRKKLRSNAMKNYRLKKKVSDVRTLVGHLKKNKIVKEEIVKNLMESVPDQARELFKRMLKNSKFKGEFPPSLRSFATTLHFHSAKAYEYVRNTFLKSLPHKLTISKWYRKIEITPGINKINLEVITRKVKESKKKNPGQSVFCNLVFDEMKIKKQVELINGKEYGYVDLGGDVNEDEFCDDATDALVVLLVCVNGNWKIPVSHYFITALTASQKVAIIKKNLKALDKTGLIVTSLTFDGLEANFAMCRKLGAKTSVNGPLKNYFLHPVTKAKVFIVSDACHVLKLLRNALGTVVMHDSEGNTVAWSFIRRIVEFQEEQQLHAANKLRRDHINYRENIMNVRLAAQTLSQSVSDALRYFEEELQLDEFQGASGTAKFCAMINAAFDILNSRNKYSKDIWKWGISAENIEKTEAKVEEIISYIKGLQLSNNQLLIQCRKKTGFIGLIISLTSALDIYHTYFKKEKAYLLTYKLSQDHLEVFFSAIRSKGGHSNNPTCFQLNYIIKKLLVHADIKGSERGNCLDFDDTEVLKIPEDMLKELSKKNAKEKQNNQTDVSEVEEDLYDDETFYGVRYNKKYIDDVVGYLAGFVTRSILKRTKCSVCLPLLTDLDEPSQSSLLEKKNRGGLVKACSDVIEICQITERQFRLLYKSKPLINSYLRKIVPKKIPMYLLPINHSDNPVEHRSILINEIIKVYLRIRQTHFEKQRSRPKKKIRRILTKLVLNRSE